MFYCTVNEETSSEELRPTHTEIVKQHLHLALLEGARQQTNIAASESAAARRSNLLAVDEQGVAIALANQPDNIDLTADGNRIRFLELALAG